MTHWNPILPGSAIAFAAVLLALVALLAAWRTRLTLPVWANLSSLGLRLIALACATALALRPETVRVETLERKPSLLLVVDDSQSLRLRDAERSPPRLEQAKAFLAGLLAGAQERGWEVNAFDASAKLQARHPKDESLRAAAPESPLGEMLAEAAQRALASANPPPPGAAVLISDGVVNRGRPLAQGAEELGRRHVPLFTATLGEATPLPPDAVIDEITVRRDDGGTGETAPPRAGERIVVEARAYFQAAGPDLTGPLADTLARLQVAAPAGGLDPAEVPGAEKPSDGTYVETETLRHRLRTAPGWTPVRMRFLARAPGLYRIRLALDPVKGERVRANNIAYASIEVLPPARKVLFVASRLGHDYRRLKTLFGNWEGPDVEVLPDFVKPTAEGDAPAPDWPAENALGRRMDEGSSTPGRAATIVWSEPDASHLSLRTMARLRSGLESGELGLVWIVGEPPAKIAQRLRGTPLEDAFLFRDYAEPLGGGDAVQEPQALSARSDARTHPITQFAFAAGPSGPDPFQVLGTTLPSGTLKVPRAGTQVLLTAGGAPVLAAGQVGQGRVVLFATGESWRWLTPSKIELERRELFAAELWRRALDWASGSASRNDPPVRVFLARDRWDLGETLNARVAVRAPAAGEPVKVEYALTPLPEDGSPPLPPAWQAFASDTGVAKNEPGGGDPMQRILTGNAGAPGSAGEWLVRVRALRPNHLEIGTDRAQAVALGSSLEERSVRPDFAGMEAAAGAGGTGGRSLRADKKELAALLNDLEPFMKGETMTREERASAVPVPALMLLLVFALIVDTWLRRG